MTLRVETTRHERSLMSENDSTTDQSGLQAVKNLTNEMRSHQDSIARLAKQRRAIVLRLRTNRITYRELAEAMDVSEVTVYKVIRGDQ